MLPRERLIQVNLYISLTLNQPTSLHILMGNLFVNLISVTKMSQLTDFMATKNAPPPPHKAGITYLTLKRC